MLYIISYNKLNIIEIYVYSTMSALKVFMIDFNLNDIVLERNFCRDTEKS